MTWEQITDELEGGNGNLDFRLEIDGLDYSFVSHIDMANALLSQKRVLGLSRKGLKISQEVQIPDMTLKLAVNNLMIVDYQEQATQAFMRKSTINAYMVDSVLSTETQIKVSNGQAIQKGDYIWAGQECMKVAGTFTDSNNITSLVVVRGQLGTIAQDFVQKSPEGLPYNTLVLNCPPTLQNRKAKLYAYSKGDDKQGNGTLIWRGVILKQPVYSNKTYSVELGPITELFKFHLGIESSEMKLRGYNFGDFGWWIRVSIQEVLQNPLRVSEASLFRGAVRVIGFYETLQDVADDINSQLTSYNATINASYNLTIGALVVGNEIVFAETKNVSNNYFALFETQQNPFRSKGASKLSNNFDIESDKKYRLGNTGDFDGGVSALKFSTSGGVYYTRTSTKTWPTQFMIYAINRGYSGWQGELVDGRKFYISAPVIPDTITDIIVQDPDEQEIASTINEFNAPLETDADNRVITTQLSMRVFQGNNINFIYIEDNNYKIFIGTSYNISRKSFNEKVINFNQFLDNLTFVSPQLASYGIMPLITRNEIDTGDIQRQFDQVSLTAFQSKRRYIFYKKTDTFEKIMAEELKILGFFPALTEDGKLTVRRLRNLSFGLADEDFNFDDSEIDFTLDSDDILTDVNYPSIVLNGFGIYNSVEIHTNFDPIENKWSNNITANNIDSIQQFQQRKAVVIKPFSKFDSNNFAFDPGNDLDSIIQTCAGLLSQDYWVVTLDVPLKYFNMNLGSVVRVINKQLPNYTPDFDFLLSRYGSSKFVGWCVGKEFDMEKGFGTIKLLVTDRQYSGTAYRGLTEGITKAIYAPGAVMTAISLLGPVGRFKVNAAMNPNAEQKYNQFDNGDTVRLDQFGSSSALTNTKGQGHILNRYTSGGEYFIDVAFLDDLPLNGVTAGSLWIIRPSDYDNPNFTTRFRKYCFVDPGKKIGSNIDAHVATLNRVLSN